MTRERISALGLYLAMMTGVCLAGDVPVAAEAFDYPDGALTRQGVGGGFGGPWKGNGEVTGGTLVLGDRSTRASRELAQPLSLTAPVYLAVTLRVEGEPRKSFSAPLSLKSATGDALAALAVNDRGFQVSVSPGAKPPVRANKNFGEFSGGQSLHCVLRLESAGKDLLASLWIDPTGPETGPLSGFAVGEIPPGSAVSEIEARLWGGEGITVCMDDIRLGTSWEAVTAP
jgi:hypothetical protein